MTARVGDVHRWAYPLLARAPYATPALDFRLLLATALQVTPTTAAAIDRDERLPARSLRWLRRAVAQRQRGLPIAYLTGYKEFYGLRFAVNRSTLVPRPESELLVTHACQLATDRHWQRIHDCGTGSGNLAIAIRHRLPTLQVSASDPSAAALRVARRNCAALLGQETAIAWRRGALLGPLAEAVDGIVANLPYLTRSELSEPSIRHEPRRALYGGRGGTTLITRLIEQAAPWLRASGALLIECGSNQVPTLRRALACAGLSVIAVHADLSGVERVIVATPTTAR